LTNSGFSPVPPGGIGFNGITYLQPNDTILFGDDVTFNLYRVPLSGPQAGQAFLVPVFERVFKNPFEPRLPASNTTAGGVALFELDGLLLTPDNRYLINTGNPSGVISLTRGRNGFAKVIRNKRFPKALDFNPAGFSPSDAIFDNNCTLWVVDSQLKEAFAGIFNRTSFIIAAIRFKQVTTC